MTKYSVFLLVQTTEHWLRLPRDERRKLSAVDIGSALAPFPVLNLRHFDTEAFSAKWTDVPMIETNDLVAYYGFMERLRDSPMITMPYFRITLIVPTIKDRFRLFEQCTGTVAAGS